MRALLVTFSGLLLISLTSCYKEMLVYPELSEGSFNFMLTSEQENWINTSRNVTFSVIDPIPVLYRSDYAYPLDKFEIRGESTLRFRRKSFALNMDTSFWLFVDSENQVRDIEEYKLISLVYDYTYIEDAVAIGFFRRLDMWPPHTEFTEVKLNDHTQGLYLFIEDPVEFYLEQKNSSIVLRRGYNHVVQLSKLNELRETMTDQYYLGRFDSIYSYIVKYSGSQLYDSLLYVMDIDQYFTKLAVDLLVQNGDATDEVFFYAKERDGQEIFGIHPWDYDDLFKVPHEIGRTWGVGTLFGTRVYYSMQDIIDDVGEKLVFSIEDDLDYKIATDDFLYQRYLEVLEQVFAIIDESVIEQVFSETKQQLQPFYDNQDIIAQSVYDEHETNQQLFDENLEEKRQYLIDRRDSILQVLPTHKN
jgi:spore coat protein H